MFTNFSATILKSCITGYAESDILYLTVTR